jgi:hypothetical protein
LAQKKFAAASVFIAQGISVMPKKQRAILKAFLTNDLRRITSHGRILLKIVIDGPAGPWSIMNRQ